ncbi:MAG: virulence factor SrfB [Desulfovibrionaceae bacterium]|nr:virulence factor SrfB [Desulfovibrionaceae bacterium]
MKFPKYKDRISLIPGGCPQLLDFACDLSQVSRIQRNFEERVEVDAKGETHTKLYPLELIEGELFDIYEHKPAQGDTYCLEAQNTLKAWLGHWFPVPFLREREQVWEDTGIKRVDSGPSNWSRALLTLDAARPKLLRIVLAFDMQVEACEQDFSPKDLSALKKDESLAKDQNFRYAALSPKDVDAHAQFRLAWQNRDNGWFLNEPWVDGWLQEIWHLSPKRQADEDGPKLDYLASYLTVLELLDLAIKDARVYLINPSRLTPIDVDFVLDIGNSRTTGILVETKAQSVTNLNDSYLLQLRDMDQPWNIYTDPFETRVEFSEINFGSEAFSRRSGRRSPAFVWPSPVRIGPEAARLSTQSECAEGSTGMSSPKRYLWDERDWQQSWRFNTKGRGEPYVTRGLLASQVNSSGTPLCCLEDPLFRNNKMIRKQEKECAFESLFTRSSLMMFLLVEVLQQALLTINSPGQRLRRESPDVPRRLRQVIFTVPAGMPLAEQRIYRRWTYAAVRVLWETLGWGAYYGGVKGNRLDLKSEYRKSPEVRCNWDEATCTQLVYIYNEISRKFQGDAMHFCSLMGQKRAQYQDHPCLRVATLDIGGGTTDLSITTFELQSDKGSSARMAPHPEFRDGFSLAGDDVLANVVRDHVLYALGEALGKAGILNVHDALAHLFGRDVIDNSQENRNRRIQFIRQVATPLALSILQVYETAELFRGSNTYTCQFKDCFDLSTLSDKGEASTWPEGVQIFNKRYPLPNKEALSYVEEYVERHGRDPNFKLLDVPLTIDLKRVNETVRAVLKDILANLCEVIYAYDCDVLLLTGRPSNWQGIAETITQFVPVPVDRIFPMGKYRVGSWYPFSDALGRVTDPKTTVVVGAILCTLAEGQLEGFSLETTSLKLTSTARYIGEMMKKTGQIKKEKVWFTVDTECPEERTYTAEIMFGGPIAVGFRQLEVERWTTTRFYLLEFASSEAWHKYAPVLPLKVTLELRVSGDEENLGSKNQDKRDEGEFSIVEILNNQGLAVPLNTLQIRLQTLPLDEGFWLDTGIVYYDE